MIIDKVSADINEREYKVQLNSAAVYYAKASIFSKWVADNLSGLKAENIKDISGLNYTTYSEVAINDAVGDENNYLKIWKSSGNVFEFSDGHDDCGTTEIKKDSSYYDHKLNVIRCSIQYNLNLAMSSYNRHVYYNDSEDDFQENANKVEEYKNTVNSTTKTRNTYTDYAMPIMKESEWEQILSNISVVSFMQGFKCGLKVYNNYVVVSSSNNEIMATPENIYYAKKDEFNDENAEYHKYNCNKLIENDSNDEYISFTSKEVKYDKLSSNSASHPYWYDHKNLACYECINDGNYDGKDIFDTSDMTEFNTYSNIRKAFYIGVAKERNNIYKMNAIKKSEGYEILFSKENINTPSIVNYTSSILDIDKVKAIEFVFGAVNVDRRDETSLTFGVTYGGRNLKEQPNNPGVSKLYSIPTNTTNYYTWNVEVDPLINNSNKFTLNSLNFNNVSDTTSFTGDLKNSIILIRIIYK